MDGRPPPRLKMLLLLVFLSTNTVRLHGIQTTGLDHRLHCVNDYLFTVNCTLSFTAENNISYWLDFTETEDQTNYVCTLTKTSDYYSCSFHTPKDLDTFSETYTYKISLCHNQEEASHVCVPLDDDYVPVENIQPNAPCCLAVSHNASQYHFTWSSTYEEHSRYTGLTADLQYQLRLRRSSDKGILHDIYTDYTLFSMDDETLEEGSEYSARVRSRPGQTFYRGQWSQWSPDAHWEATNHHSPSRDLPRNKILSQMGKFSKLVFVPLCVTVLLLLLLCYAPVKKWRKNIFIPTPAPYFDTLYGDCKGDFKSWAVAQETPGDVMDAEETLQIDTVTKCVDDQEEDGSNQEEDGSNQEEDGSNQEEDHSYQEEDHSYQRPRQLTEDDHSYRNVDVPLHDAALLGLPYTVITTAPQSGWSAGEPGCRLYSNMLEKDPPWYCNEYCTLTSFQLRPQQTNMEAQ